MWRKPKTDSNSSEETESSPTESNAKEAAPSPQQASWQQPSITMYLAVLSALLGGIGFGFAIGWTAPAFESLARNGSKPHLTEPKDKEILSWISSSMTVSALIGALASGYFVEKYGRRLCLIFYGIPFTLAWLIIVLAWSAWMLLIGRIILGLAVGASSGTVPSYIVEISTAKIRGAIGAFFQLSIVIGILMAFSIGASMEWRKASAISMIPTIMLSASMFLMPESPNWLVMKDRYEEAKQALKRIRSSNSDIEKEFQALVESKPKTKDKKTDFSMYLTRKHLCPLILSLGLMLFQQLSGVNAVMFYSTAILKESGSSISASVGTIIIGAAQVLFTGLASALIDYTGRKTLLILSGGLHVISLAVLGIYYQLTSRSTSTVFGWIPVVCMVVFIMGFSIGWGPVPWLMVAEISPNESKSFIASMSTCLNWLGAFVVTKTFKQLQEALTKEGVFYLFSALSFLSILFTIFALPETKNKSFEEIQRMLERKSTNPKLSSSESTTGSIITHSSESTE